MIDPLTQITICKEVPPEEGNELGEQPSEPGIKLKILNKQHREPRFPDFDIDRILSYTHKNFGLEA
jgi:hypothetical protein